MKIVSIVKEEIQKFQEEGVADKAAERMFNIPDPNVEMDRKAVLGIKPDNNSNNPDGEFVGDVTDLWNEKKILSKIFLNPKSLQNFDANVRALSTKDGDLFVGLLDTGYYHNGISMGVTKSGKYNIPDAYDRANVIQWHRIESTDNFGFSISFMEQWKFNRHAALPLLIAVQKKNPQFKFHPAFWVDIKRGDYDMNQTTDLSLTGIDAIKNAVENNPKYEPIKSIDYSSIDKLQQQKVRFEQLQREVRNNRDYDYYGKLIELITELLSAYGRN